MNVFEINGRKVGEGFPVYVIAEIGSNHNGEYGIALEMIDRAKEAGCDAVKFQTFRAKDHYSVYTPLHSKYDKNIHELIEELEIDRSWHAKLKKYCDGKGIDFFTSPCDRESVDEMKALGCGVLKVASFDMTDVTLVEYMAKTGLGVILSTGLAAMGDIENAVNACRRAGNGNFALLQCTSLYPAPAHLSNLRAMDTMARAFGCVTGYSDHTMGDHIPVAAVAMGAKIIEKHFTLSRVMSGPDHPFAIEPDELKAMVEKIRDVEQAFGDGMKNGARDEEKENFGLRRSIIAARDIAVGSVITADDIVIKRPGYGILPQFRDIVTGRTAKRDIKADEWITWEMV